MNKLFILLVFSFIYNYSLAQDNRYVVYFTDKDNTPYTISQPHEFLSERAIQRRHHQGIAVSSQDFPVNPWYLDSLRERGAEVFFTSRWFNAALVQATPDEIESLKAISIVASVDYAAPGKKLSGLKKNNIHTTKESGHPVQNTFHRIHEMHEDGFTGEGVWIAIFDGGFAGVDTAAAFDHLLVNDRIIMAKNLVNNDNNVYQFSDHGTMVLSIISGLLPDEFTGIAYNASVGLFVTEEVATEYRIEEYNWLFAAEMADSAGFDIINTSLGYSTFDDPEMNYTYEDMNGSTAVISRASDFASERGILTVTSAGNEGSKTWKYITAPADAFYNITVGAVNSFMNRSSFSSIGPTSDGRIKPDLAALGSGVTVITGNGSISSGSGTSFAAPVVTGLAAGVWESFPELTMTALRELLISWTSHPTEPNELTGHGVLTYNGEPPFIIVAIDPVREKLKFYPNPAQDRVSIVNLPADAKINLIDATGKKHSQEHRRGSIDISKLKKGLYFLQVESPSGLFTGKFIKE